MCGGMLQNQTLACSRPKTPITTALSAYCLYLLYLASTQGYPAPVLPPGPLCPSNRTLGIAHRARLLATPCSCFWHQHHCLVKLYLP